MKTKEEKREESISITCPSCDNYPFLNLDKEKPKETKIANQSDVYLLNEAMTSIFDNNLTYNIRPTGVPIRSLFISSTVFDNSSKLIFETSIDL